MKTPFANSDTAMFFSESASPAPTRSVSDQLLLRAGGVRMHADSRVRILRDSTENFPAWLEAVQSANRYILMEMYIFADDPFGRQMLDLLVEKSRSGVRVVLVYDWLGSMLPAMKNFFKPLRDAGGEVRAYNPPGFASGIGLLSRDHRKSIVVDGHTAFVGGLCVSSAWQGQPEKGTAPWRDTGVELHGAVVGDVIRALADTLHSQNYALPADIVCDIPADGSGIRTGIAATTPADNNLMRIDLNVVALANRRLWLTDAYFMPTRLYTQALANAAEAGVDVRILVPRTSDIGWIARVSRTRYRELLRTGVRIFEWNGTMIHAKTAVADGIWARIGSTNLNFSSWHLNRELDVLIEDAGTAAQLEQQFLHDLRNATEIVLNDEERAETRRRRLQWLRRLKIANRQQALAAARQFMQLSHAFEGNLYGTGIVDEREIGAYLWLGFVLLTAAVVLWFFPRLLVLPLVLLAAAGGLSTLVYALKTRRRFIRSKRNKAQNGGTYSEPE